MKEVNSIINTIRQKKDLIVLTEFNKVDNLRDDYVLDSLDLAELAVKVEAVFNIDIFHEGIIDSYGEILEILKEKSS